ncbi:hypothetical protein HOY80DRAFT_324883 [Tuber brumale]|nr:hypothetical protein HOY80DRAFT_324883 [Tuber brumale]
MQLGLWKCGVIAPKSTSLSGKLSFRRESHITHSNNAHNIVDKHEIQKWTNKAHIGRNNFKTLWRGFCSKERRDGLSIKGCVVQLKKKGQDGWDERFGHLGSTLRRGTISGVTRFTMTIYLGICSLQKTRTTMISGERTMMLVRNGPQSNPPGCPKRRRQCYSLPNTPPHKRMRRATRRRRDGAV